MEDLPDVMGRRFASAGRRRPPTCPACGWPGTPPTSPRSSAPWLPSVTLAGSHINAVPVAADADAALATGQGTATA